MNNSNSDQKSSHSINLSHKLEHSTGLLVRKNASNSNNVRNFSTTRAIQETKSINEPILIQYDSKGIKTSQNTHKEAPNLSSELPQISQCNKNTCQGCKCHEKDVNNDYIHVNNTDINKNDQNIADLVKDQNGQNENTQPNNVMTPLNHIEIPQIAQNNPVDGDLEPEEAHKDQESKHVIKIPNSPQLPLSDSNTPINLVNQIDTIHPSRNEPIYADFICKDDPNYIDYTKIKLKARQKPRFPDDNACCGSGCERCVFDIYDDNLEKWSIRRDRAVQEQIDEFNEFKNLL
jgi:hypothetical protein